KDTIFNNLIKRMVEREHISQENLVCN
ncbi:hypothetical protein SAMN05443429_1244, partial [Cruoricaptor ignavus]